MSQFSYSNLSVKSSQNCILSISSFVLQTSNSLLGHVASHSVSKLHRFRSEKSGRPSSTLSSHSTRAFCRQSWKLSIAVRHPEDVL